MPSSQSNGTQAATISTEHTLATLTDVGTYQLYIDASAMVNSDILELRIKERVLSGGTTRIAYLGVFTDIQPEPILVSIPIVVLHSAIFSLLQSAGTGRSFPWDIRQLDA